MIKNIPVEKNKEYELYIESVTSEGMGVSHIDGFCIFVANAVTRDRVNALILKVKSGYGYAKITGFIEKSPYRREVVCPVFSKCGGCQLMHIDYNYQLEIKKNIIKDALQRIGGFDIEINEMIGADNEYSYRNKMIFPIGKDKENVPVCGFFRERSHDIIPLERCFLGNEVNQDVTKAFIDFIKEKKISIYDEQKHKGVVRRLFIRNGHKTGDLMVVISVNAEKLPYYEELIKRLLQISENIKSIILNINTKKTNLVLGDKNIILYGKEYIQDYLCGMKFEISPYSFFQINPVQAEKLYCKAIELADIKDSDRVLDIYCGIGTISLACAQKAGFVIGVEIVEQAILDARKNAQNNNIKNTEFYASDASKIVPELIEKGERPNIVILDPPRKGSDTETLDAIIKAAPEKIVYVSCNPATLARDLKYLKDGGYEPRYVCGVDMFAQTVHIETCILLTAKKSL